MAKTREERRDCTFGAGFDLPATSSVTGNENSPCGSRHHAVGRQLRTRPRRVWDDERVCGGQHLPWKRRSRLHRPVQQQPGRDRATRRDGGSNPERYLAQLERPSPGRTAAAPRRAESDKERPPAPRDLQSDRGRSHHAAGNRCAEMHSRPGMPAVLVVVADTDRRRHLAAASRVLITAVLSPTRPPVLVDAEVERGQVEKRRRKAGEATPAGEVAQNLLHFGRIAVL
jgi:hypothetical protein